jgi:hypothetical protein
MNGYEDMSPNNQSTFASYVPPDCFTNELLAATAPIKPFVALFHCPFVATAELKLNDMFAPPELVIVSSDEPPDTTAPVTVPLPPPPPI